MHSSLEDLDRPLELSVAALQRPDLRSRFTADTLTLPIIDLLLTDPVAQRLGVHPQPRGHGLDRRPLARVVAPMIQHQTDRLGPDLRVVPTRHETQPSKEGGAHQTRDASWL